MFLYILLVKQVTTSHTPCKKCSILVKSTKKSILLSPHKIILLGPHTQEMNRICMRERQHTNRIPICQETKSLWIWAKINDIFDSTDSITELETDQFLWMDQTTNVNAVDAIAFESDSSFFRPERIFTVWFFVNHVIDNLIDSLWCQDYNVRFG